MSICSLDRNLVQFTTSCALLALVACSDDAGTGDSVDSSSGSGGAQFAAGTGGEVSGVPGSGSGSSAGGSGAVSGGGSTAGGGSSAGAAPGVGSGGLAAGGSPGVGSGGLAAGGSPGVGSGGLAAGGSPGVGSSPGADGGSPGADGGSPGADGGSPGAGGEASGGAPDGSGGSTVVVIPDHDAAEAITACVDSLPWGQGEFANNKDEILAAIINTCTEFAPPGDEWQTYCQMFLATSINKESSYNAQSIVEDSYGGASDPTVGLLQIRFSSTVKDYVEGGNLAAMDRIGCDLSGVNASGDGAGHMSLMQNPTCNIALGAWYYFVYATGNGGSSVTYLYEYCQGNGTGADLTMGMLSHLKGPEGALGGGGDDGGYVDTITEWFDKCMDVNGFAVGSPHPFDLPLSPEPNQYCSQ